MLTTESKVYPSLWFSNYQQNYMYIFNINMSKYRKKQWKETHTSGISLYDKIFYFTFLFSKFDIILSYSYSKNKLNVKKYNFCLMYLYICIILNTTCSFLYFHFRESTHFIFSFQSREAMFFPFPWPELREVVNRMAELEGRLRGQGLESLLSVCHYDMFFFPPRPKYLLITGQLIM